MKKRTVSVNEFKFKGFTVYDLETLKPCKFREGEVALTRTGEVILIQDGRVTGFIGKENNYLIHIADGRFFKW